VVKNRRKNGDHYWVVAHVVPIMKGKPLGYMSVREKALPEQIQAAEALYARITQERESGHHTFKLHAGRVRQLGLRDLPGKLHRFTLTQRLTAGMGVTTAAMLAAIALVPSAPCWRPRGGRAGHGGRGQLVPPQHPAPHGRGRAVRQ
jgi:aerotaxis receptor